MNFTIFLTLQTAVHIAIFMSQIGILGIISNKKNLLMALISIEMMFFGLNLLLIVYSLLIDDGAAGFATVFILTLAAADSALALAIMTVFFKVHGEITLNKAENDFQRVVKKEETNLQRAIAKAKQ